ncbi:hypothetical protein BVY01_01300, partial [bacterium I07]
MKIGRKEFIKTTAMLGTAGAMGLSGQRRSNAAEPGKSGSVDALKISFPRDGDVLNRHDGVEKADRLLLTVTGSMPPESKVLVNGIRARSANGTFSCDVPITRKTSKIVATTGDTSDEITVWWNKGSKKRFRFSVDDNIQFLKDLGLNPEKYNSLFDHWYLRFYRDMHKEFDAKVHLNIYYQTDGFNLAEMPDQWKEEWQD